MGARNDAGLRLRVRGLREDVRAPGPGRRQAPLPILQEHQAEEGLLGPVDHLEGEGGGLDGLPDEVLLELLTLVLLGMLGMPLI
jgi:hypothetical protein